MPRQRGPFQIKSVIEKRYRIVCEVGRGGFAVVYKVREKQLQRFVAIKALSAQGDGSEDVQRRFVEEPRKLAKVKSPHVVNVYNDGNHEGVRYFVMEYVPFSVDGLLQESFEDHPVEHELATRILKQTLQGLAEVHDRGWTHRDIKPGNILLTDDDEVRLADFGVMKDPDSPRTEKGAIVGTPGWMAPEQRAGREVSSRTDVYAFGLVACRLIAGDHWDASSPVDLSQYTDRGTAQLVLQCLKEKPSDRPEDARVVLQQWARIEELVQKKRRRPPIRGHALVRNVKSRIEREYGLPQGSVKLVYPGNTRAVRADVKISRVRLMWGE